MTPRLYIELLGPFRAYFDGQAIAFDTAKELAIFARLLLDGPQSRAMLAADLWPAMDEERAAKNLRQALYRLGKALTPLTDAYPAALAIGSAHVALDLAAIPQRIDLHDFRRLIDGWRAHAHPPDGPCALCFERLLPALMLPRGTLLQGLTLRDADDFNFWLEQQRDQLRDEMIDALAYLSDADYRAGDFTRARIAAEMQITLDPWREQAYRQVMRTAAALGQPSAAVRRYETLRRRLHTDLQLAPQPATTALLEQIRRDGGHPPAVLRHLPPELTPFFGRRDELNALTHWLVDPLRRWVTIVGEGGMGKTRLALAAARRVAHSFTDGVTFVALADVVPPVARPTGEAVARPTGDAVAGPIGEAAGGPTVDAVGGPTVDAVGEAVAEAIARAHGVALAPRAPAADQLAATLASQQLLLVLDNFEQLLPAAPLLDRLLTACPYLTLLVTSRTPLGALAEQVYALNGLALVERPGDSEAAAVALFAERAERADGHFVLDDTNRALVLDICAHVIGNPLAIELAAQQAARSGAAATLAALQRGDYTLAATLRGLPARQASMAAVFAGTLDLLPRVERAVLRWLALWPSSFDVPAVRALCSALTPHSRVPDDALTQALDSLQARLLIRPTGMPGRLALHALLRDFLQTTIAAGERDAFARAHSAYYCEQLHAQQAALLQSPATVTALLDELPNLSNAWQWALHHDTPAQLLRGAQPLTDLLRLGGRLREGGALLAHGVATADARAAAAPPDSAAHADWLRAAAWLRLHQAVLLQQRNQFESAAALVTAAEATARRLDDRALLAQALAAHVEAALLALDQARLVALLADLRALATQAVAEDAPPGLAARMLRPLVRARQIEATLAYQALDLPAAVAAAGEAVALADAHGLPFLALVPATMQAQIWLKAGRLDRAQPAAQAALTRAAAFPHAPDQLLAYNAQATLAWLLGDWPTALALAQTLTARAEQIQRPAQVAGGLALQTLVALEQADAAAAAQAADALAALLPALPPVLRLSNVYALVCQRLAADRAAALAALPAQITAWERAAGAYAGMAQGARAALAQAALAAGDTAAAVAHLTQHLDRLDVLEFNSYLEPERLALALRQVATVVKSDADAARLTAAAAQVADFIARALATIEDPAVRAQLRTGRRAARAWWSQIPQGDALG